MKFYHDYARPYITKIVKSHFNDTQLKITRQPQYSTGLAPPDYKVSI